MSPAGPDHLWEIANSFQGLFHGADTLSFGPWRRLVRPRLGGPADRLLAGLLPGRGYFPDFLTPAAGGQGELAAALDTVLRAPRAALRDDLALLAASPHRRRPLPDLTGALDSARSSGTRRPATTSSSSSTTARGTTCPTGTARATSTMPRPAGSPRTSTVRAATC
ncbi:hypothetical protein AB0D38_29960 [Streptomyces sp. NPDC048279]|uniref:hypothetical protein n=1 Tax=Streptomyces sp. NPDC048279 TaxID=3154714 RepID=UPI00343B93A0